MPVINGVWRPVLTFPFGTITAGTNAFNRGTLLLGFAVVEATGTLPAELDIYDGNNANGALLRPITLNANESTSDYWGPEGVYCEQGPFLNVVSGSVRGALWYIDATAADLGTLPALTG